MQPRTIPIWNVRGCTALRTAVGEDRCTDFARIGLHAAALCAGLRSVLRRMAALRSVRCVPHPHRLQQGGEGARHISCMAALAAAARLRARR